MSDAPAAAEAPVALVTGASRGIGKAIALRLAEAGFDVAVTARTQREGEGRSESNSVRSREPVVAIPGSLETTAREIEARGRRALPVRMDLLDAAAVVEAPRRVLAEWGRVDVLVNNAILQAGASMDRILDLTAESMSRLVTANYVHQVLLTQQVVPHMVERGSARPAGPRRRRRLGHRLLGVEGGLRSGRRRPQRRVRAGGPRLQRRPGQRRDREAPGAAAQGRLRGRLRRRAAREDGRGRHLAGDQPRCGRDARPVDLRTQAQRRPRLAAHPLKL
jgi:NAD(P)-dependent dehydrogenase (short-subunit alcohol dehydrogenase family)